MRHVADHVAHGNLGSACRIIPRGNDWIRGGNETVPVAQTDEDAVAEWRCSLEQQ